MDTKQKVLDYLRSLQGGAQMAMNPMAVENRTPQSAYGTLGEGEVPGHQFDMPRGDAGVAQAVAVPPAPVQAAPEPRAVTPEDLKFQKERQIRGPGYTRQQFDIEQGVAEKLPQ